MKTVYLLWCIDEDGFYLDGVFSDKTDAEKEMRLLKEQDKDRGMEEDYFYRIEEKEVK